MTKTKKNLFIHAGLPKCASTSLQKFLLQNKEVLHNKGFLFPSRENKKLFCESHNGADIALYIREDNNESLIKRFNVVNFSELERENYIKNLENSFNYMKQQINDSDLNNIILTSEFFSGSKPNILKLKNEFKEFDIKLIFYIRASVPFLCSSFQEGIRCRVRNTHPFEEFFKGNMFFSYLNNINNYSKEFEKENIIIRPLEKEQLKNGCVYSDFLNILGLELDNDFTLLEKNLNESNIFELTELLRLINRLPYDIKVKNKMREFAFKVEFTNNTKIIDTLTQEQIQKINAKYEPILKEFAKKFFNREQLFLNDQYEAKSTKTSLNNQDIEDILKTMALKLEINT